MRKLALPLVIAGLLLGACSGQSNNPNNNTGTNQSAPAPIPSAVTGTVTLADNTVQITPQAKLDLTLMDVTQQPGVPVNSQSFAPPHIPQKFDISFDPKQIKATDIYVLQAKMENEGRVFSTTLQTPVLTHGAPANVNLQLVAEPTAADKMLSDFKTMQSRIGGMKMTQGTASNDQASRGWQVFSDKNGVEFIRELVDKGDKGNYTSTDYAYQDGRPWVVVQETSPKKGAPISSTDRAGWDESGELVLKQHEENGKIGELSHDAASALHDQAEALYKQFNKKPKH
ncbi:MAG TPA: YbaY family lipoprotein [Rhodanobacteraceae bacterium]|nr:YbaY family lipoprotein [Rhodanobacteraceae bacterium]